ncbi:MAG: YrdB family protein [Halobacteriales archaeon]
MSATDIGPNDALRFALELGSLAALAFWGWTATDGALRVGLAVGLPLVVAVLWGTFRVPDDPGPAPVAIPGPRRLVLEWILFGVAAVALADAGQPLLAGGFVTLVLAHYAVARDRVQWLLGRSPR